jgi:phosphate uptake regulator
MTEMNAFEAPRGGAGRPLESSPMTSLLDTSSGSVRRLQRMGAVTVGVSLPRTWVSERDLGVGSPVVVKLVSNGAIVIRSPSGADARVRAQIEVESGPPPEHLFRRLIGSYLRGAEEFIVHQEGGLAPTTRTTVRTFQRRTVHPQIVFEDRENIVLRDVSNGANLGIPVLLRRMFQVVLEMHEDAAKTWQTGSAPSDESMETRDDEVDRYAWLIERTLALRLRDDPGGTSLGGPFEGPLPVFLLTRCLERIADHAVILADNGGHLRESSMPAPTIRALTGYHRQVLDQLRAAFSVAEHPDAKVANEVLDGATALEATHATLAGRFLTPSTPSTLPAAALTSLGLILQSIDRTTAYARDIAQIGLGRGDVEIPVPPPRVSIPTPRFARPLAP